MADPGCAVCQSTALQPERAPSPETTLLGDHWEWQGASCQPGADEPELLREVPEHQRISSPRRMQVTTPASPPSISHHEITAAGGEAEAQLWVTFQG